MAIKGVTVHTDEHGITLFAVPYNETIIIRVTTNGWLETRSVEVDIGRVEPSGDTISGIFSAAACAFSMGAVCLTRQAILLEGDEATLTFQMIREVRTADLVIDARRRTHNDRYQLRDDQRRTVISHPVSPAG